MPGSSEPVVYQLRVLLLAISPLIWRRLLLRSDFTIADLHLTIQIAFSCSDIHLHPFLIHGKQYAISSRGGLSFRDDPHEVKLSDFQFRLREKFLYEYVFRDNWQHLIRVEAILLPEPDHCYPVCIGGQRSAPPEDCGGAWTYLALRQQYSVWFVLERLTEILHDEDISDHLEELVELRRWLEADRFDPCSLNRKLKQYATKDEAWTKMRRGSGNKKGIENEDLSAGNR